MQFGNSPSDFGGTAFRRPFVHDSACGLSKLVALLPNSMQIVHNLSEKGVELFLRSFNKAIRMRHPRTNRNESKELSPSG